ncbi:MAG: hypothetical protein JWR40_4303 [Massilia sp.]|nr:hypothetical protein [Massilia sp.]MDB5948811.1 hypothetical protein [Massilia sp.]
MHQSTSLTQVVQSFIQSANFKAGGQLASELPVDDAREVMHAELKKVQSKNELYFKCYWFTMMAAFAVTVVVALYFRNEMGGLAVVLGGGGVIQGGLSMRMAAELKEKARVDIVSVLAVQLPAEQLHVILRDLLGTLRK